MSTTIQLRSKRTLTIPADVRERYAFEEGDVFTLVDLGDGSLFLAPRVSIVPKLAQERQPRASRPALPSAEELTP